MKSLFSHGARFDRKASRNSRVAAAPCLAEALESRLFLDSTVYNLTQLTPVTFTDGDGTKITIKLKGPGSGTLSAGDVYDLSLVNTTGVSTLTITTLKPTVPGDDGRFSLRLLAVGDPRNAADHTSIGSIVASTTDITGGIGVAGTAAAITVGRITGQLYVGTPLIAPATSPTVKLTLGNITDLALTSNIGISQLSAPSWLDTDATRDSLSAPFLSTLKITGNFEPNVTITSTHGLALTSPVLTSASISGNVPASTQYRSTAILKNRTSLPSWRCSKSHVARRLRCFLSARKPPWRRPWRPASGSQRSSVSSRWLK